MEKSIYKGPGVGMSSVYLGNSKGRVAAVRRRWRKKRRKRKWRQKRRGGKGRRASEELPATPRIQVFP